MSEAGFRVGENVSLAGRNTFRVEARAELLADVHDPFALPALLSEPWLQFAPLLVLGEGSNVLLAGDVPGLTLSLTRATIAIIDDGADHALVAADAGVNWNDFVHWTLGHGLCGLENLALIPGTVGACPIQNIGAYGTEVAEFIDSVQAFDRETLRLREFEREDCRFGYRDSAFKRAPEQNVVTEVRFRLPKSRGVQTGYAGVGDELAAMGVNGVPTHRQVAEAISRLRTRKLPNPALLGNAGSFFKNPIVAAAQAEALKATHPALPVFPGDSVATRKLSAAWLIEQAGWKGHREGDAGVAAQHALVLVNHGRATGGQLLALAGRIAGSVQARFGVRLEPEPRIIGGRFEAIATT
ncbi:MAG TPA: UDP-N-acetylenolpyruvoylglucosamine reductase [Xanthomonadaceae bacterium]|jgi:UDP-N-acetylmuramate dehydrogenase|nr:UDP-N-acetylenolpyruvoylglucosamine reductase [Xanthomonadaceae bacterium]